MREAKLWLNKNREEKVTILVYSLIYPYLKAAIDLKKCTQMFKFVVSYWICLNILEIALLYCTVF